MKTKARNLPEPLSLESMRSAGKSATDEQRSELDEIFEQSPSLRRYAEQDLERVYLKAVRLASRETGLEAGSFPPNCPYSVDQLLDIGYLP